MGDRITVNQLEYITDANGAPMMDFVGRCETIPTTSRAFAGPSASGFTRRAMNRSAHGPYRDYYSDATRAVAPRASRATSRISAPILNTSGTHERAPGGSCSGF